MQEPSVPRRKKEKTCQRPRWTAWTLGGNEIKQRYKKKHGGGLNCKVGGKKPEETEIK